MKRSDCLRALLGLGFALLASGGTASATTFTYVVVGGGLDVGHACLSSAGSGLCAAEAKFNVGATFPISGSFTYDDVANTIDIDITLATGTMTGSHDGVSDVVFSTVNYVVEDMGVALAFGNQLFGASATGSITGTYEQFNAGPSVVPSAAVDASSIFDSFSCSNLDAVGLCGLTVGGAARDFNMDVGVTGSGDSFDFVHRFDFNVVVPEPTSGSLLALGLTALGLVRRRS